MCLSMEHRAWSIEIADFELRISDLTKKSRQGAASSPATKLGTGRQKRTRPIA